MTECEDVLHIWRQIGPAAAAVVEGQLLDRQSISLRLSARVIVLSRSEEAAGRTCCSLQIKSQ